MSTDEDPEVRADIELRAQTERERGNRDAPMPVWVRPEPAARWPCRACREYVEVSGDAVAAFITFSNELKRRGEEPLDVARIVFCDSCRVQWRAALARRASEVVEKTRELIIALKRGVTAEREREITEQLTKLGHPDVPGLVQSIRDRRASKGRRTEGRDL